MNAIHAIYEHGVFRPADVVDLPEHAAVIVRPVEPARERIVLDDDGDDPEFERKLDAVYEVLSMRFDSGETDVAARHDEHQP